MTMNDNTARLLNLRDGFAGLDPDAGLAPGLRARIDRGIECRGGIVSWAPPAEAADFAPGRHHSDLTGWECSETSFHLEYCVPID